MLSIESNQSPEPPDDFQFIQYLRPIIEIRLHQIGDYHRLFSSFL